MYHREFHGEKFFQLGFGLMRLPVIDQDQSKVDYDKVEEMFLYAYENGVNYYDTAYPYHNAHSEMTLGKILENNHLRGKVSIATKLFTLGMERPDYNPKAMFEEQLSRLKTDHIDFYLIHGLHGDQWETLKNKFDILPFLDKLRRDGTIRHIGFSFHDEYPVFKRIIDDYDWEFAQIQYNYLDNQIQAGDAGLEYARCKGIPLNIMEPLKGGNLIFPDYPEIDAIKARHGLESMSNAELGLRYVFDKSGLLVVLSGMSTLEQVKENIAIANRCEQGCFTAAEQACVEEIRAFLEKIENIQCTGCRYCCEGCPQNIQIPAAFSLYNSGKKYNNRDAQMRIYERSCSNLADCVECGQCVEACPQHLEIPELLKEVRNYFGNE